MMSDPSPIFQLLVRKRMPREIGAASKAAVKADNCLGDKFFIENIQCMVDE
jgi:hypothetical protein